MNFGKLGRVFGRLGASIKAGTGGGAAPAAPDDTTSANEYLIFFI